MVYYGRLGKKMDFFLEKNQFNMLLMVQFECPRVVSFTFEEFPFLVFSPCSFLPLPGVIQNGLLWETG